MKPVDEMTLNELNEEIALGKGWKSFKFSGVIWWRDFTDDSCISKLNPPDYSQPAEVWGLLMELAKYFLSDGDTQEFGKLFFDSEEATKKEILRATVAMQREGAEA